MEELLQEIKALPGVVGATIFSTEQGVLGADLPETLNDPSLQQIGQTVDRAFAALAEPEADQDSLWFQFAESAVSARRLMPRVSLIIICESGADLSRLTRTIEAVSGELKKSAQGQLRKNLVKPD